MDKAEMDDTPTEELLVLDAKSFDSAERLECQVRFDIPFGDLMQYTLAAVDARRTEPLQLLVTRAGETVWPDQVMQFMVWVQARRTDPTVTLEDFDGLTLPELVSARVRGAVGKAPTTTTSPRSSPVPASSDSSEGA